VPRFRGAFGAPSAKGWDEPSVSIELGAPAAALQQITCEARIEKVP